MLAAPGGDQRIEQHLVGRQHRGPAAFVALGVGNIARDAPLGGIELEKLHRTEFGEVLWNFRDRIDVVKAAFDRALTLRRSMACAGPERLRFGECRSRRKGRRQPGQKETAARQSHAARTTSLWISAKNPADGSVLR